MAKVTQADQGDQARERSAASVDRADTMEPRSARQGRLRLVFLVIGDILCFLLFVSLGSNAHGKGVHPLYSLWLSVPFLLAWFLISPFVGAFRARLFARPVKMLGGTALAWVATWPVAMGLRWLLIERVDPVPLSSFLSFSTVVLLVNLVLLPGWRGLFALGDFLLTRGRHA